MSVEARNLSSQYPHIALASNPDYSAVTGLVSVVVEENGMKAYAITTPPMNGVLNFSEQEMLALVRNYGVTHGLIKDFINFIPVGKKAKTLVAVGTHPTPGQDAQLKVNLVQESRELPADTGKRDHRDVNHFIKVHPGEIVAEKTPATPGTPGMTVTGEPVPATPGRDILLMSGQNTILSNDQTVIMATDSGVLQQNGDHIDVAKLLEIEGDVDYSVGNIDFEGCVHVRGDVLPGFTIIASDSIEIDGFVERSTLEAGGDIQLHNGYYGDGNCHIKACGNLTARSLESANVKVLKNLNIKKYMVNSTVIAGGDVSILDKRRGRISGGRITAGGNLHSCHLGSPSSVCTIVDIGNSVEIGADKSMHFNMSRYYDQRLEKINGAIALLRKRHMDTPLNTKETQILHTLEGKARQCREQIRNLFRSNMAFQLKKKQENTSYVRISGTGYAGVQIQAASEFMDFNDDFTNVVVQQLTGSLVARSAMEN